MTPQPDLDVAQPFTLTANRAANLTLDLNLEQSIRPTGTQNYLLDPQSSRLVNNPRAGTISGAVALSALQSNSACLQGASTGSGSLPDAHGYIFSGTVKPASDLTFVVDSQINLSSSGQYSYDEPFLPAGSDTVSIACTSASTANMPTVVAFIPAAGTPATVTANHTTTINL